MNVGHIIACVDPRFHAKQFNRYIRTLLLRMDLPNRPISFSDLWYLISRSRFRFDQDVGFALEDLLKVNFTLQRVGASVEEIGIDSRATLDDMLTAREKLIETQGSTAPASNPLAKALLLASGGGPREDNGGGRGGGARSDNGGGGSDSDPNLSGTGIGGSGATLRRTRCSKK